MSPEVKPGTRHWLVLVAGGHAAGKKVVCKDLESSLKSVVSDDLPVDVETIHMADYFKDVENSDGPEKQDFTSLKAELKNKQVQAHHQLITIVEGLYALYDQEIRDMAIMKVFVDSDADTRLSRWILRDIGDDQNKLGGILDNYLNHARPEMNQYVAPTKQYADVILPRGSEESGVQLISTGVYDRIREESLDHTAVQSGAATPLLGQSVVNLQKESYMEQSQRFYDLS